MNKKITVVIPTWQRAELLNRTLEALQNQRFPKNDFEVIVVSDGIDDETGIIVSHHISNGLPATYYALKENKGPAAARNVGWQNGSGLLIAFTDDDCLPDAMWLESLWSAFETYNQSVVAFSGRIVVPVNKKPTDYEINTQNLERSEFVTANCACSKLALQITGGFDEAFRMAWREDSDLYFKFIENSIHVYHIDEAVVVHPVRKAPWGVSIKEQKKSMFNVLLYKKYPKLYRERIQPSPPWLYYLIVVSFLIFIIALCITAKTLLSISLTAWLIFTVFFISKRLAYTSRSANHIGEMIFTSFVIPFLSVFWRFYGSLKYKKLLI